MHDFPTHNRFSFVRDNALRDLIAWLDQTHDHLSYLSGKAETPELITILEDARDAVAEAVTYLCQRRGGQS